MVDQMIYIKVHSSENGDIVALCDSTLITKVLKEGELEINLKDYSEFYKGELVSNEKAIEILISVRRLLSANIIGKESVNAAVKAGIIVKDSIKMVDKVPYAYAFRVKY